MLFVPPTNLDRAIAVKSAKEMSKTVEEPVHLYWGKERFMYEAGRLEEYECSVPGLEEFEREQPLHS